MKLEVALWRKLPALRRAVLTDGLNRSSFKWRAFGDTDQALSERKHRLVWSTDSMTQTLLKAPASCVTLPLSSGLAVSGTAASNEGAGQPSAAPAPRKCAFKRLIAYFDRSSAFAEVAQGVTA